MVKTVMPNFSLDEGFEFTNAVAKGERQCLLQSVILAGLLQRAGMDAGIVMVWRNLRGEATNNSHCVTLVHLPTATTRNWTPPTPSPLSVTRACSANKTACATSSRSSRGHPHHCRLHRFGSGQRLTPRQVRPLQLAFVSSQFDYYRGERTPGGLLAAGAHPRRPDDRGELPPRRHSARPGERPGRLYAGPRLAPAGQARRRPPPVVPVPETSTPPPAGPPTAPATSPPRLCPRPGVPKTTSRNVFCFHPVFATWYNKAGGILKMTVTLRPETEARLREEADRSVKMPLPSLTRCFRVPWNRLLVITSRPVPRLPRALRIWRRVEQSPLKTPRRLGGKRPRVGRVPRRSYDINGDEGLQSYALRLTNRALIAVEAAYVRFTELAEEAVADAWKDGFYEAIAGLL